VAEYYLRILARETVTKRMEADDDDTAIRAAIRWEGQNPDMDLTCGLRRVALRRKSVWYLRPDAGCEEDEELARQAVDDFTIAAGWTGQAPVKAQPPTGAEEPQARQAQAKNTSAIMQKLLGLLQRLD
jgi:hypothetical protein